MMRERRTDAVVDALLGTSDEQARVAEGLGELRRVRAVLREACMHGASQAHRALFEQALLRESIGHDHLRRLRGRGGSGASAAKSTSVTSTS